MVTKKFAQEAYSDKELFMAKQPINIMFFDSLANKLYPNASKEEKRTLLPSLFGRLSDSKIHNVIGRLARLKLEQSITDEEIKSAIDILTEVVIEEE